MKIQWIVGTVQLEESMIRKNQVYMMTPKARGCLAAMSAFGKSPGAWKISSSLDSPLLFRWESPKVWKFPEALQDIHATCSFWVALVGHCNDRGEHGHKKSAEWVELEDL